MKMTEQFFWRIRGMQDATEIYVTDGDPSEEETERRRVYIGDRAGADLAEADLRAQGLLQWD